MDQRTGEMNRLERNELGSELFAGDEEVVRNVGPQGETERLRADIEDTRAEMGQTINEIQERLSPEHIIEQVKGSVREATIGKVERAMNTVGEKISDVADPALDAMGRAGTVIKDTGAAMANTVRQNPIPAALIGLGLGMLVVNRWRGSESRRPPLRVYGSGSEGNVAEIEGDVTTILDRSTQQPQGAMNNAFDQAKGSARDLANSALDSLTNIGDRTKEGTLRVSRGLQRVARENPLAVGAVAVAVGAAVGLAVPASQVEEEYMGEASDKLKDKTKQVVRETMDKVQVAAQQAAGAGHE